MKYNIRNKHCKELDCFASVNGKCTVLEETYPYLDDCPFYKERFCDDPERAADIQTYRYCVKRIEELHNEFLEARKHLDELKRKLSEARTSKTKYKNKIRKRMKEEGAL